MNAQHLIYLLGDVPSQRPSRVPPKATLHPSATGRAHG